jgi:hypothetical protein
MNMSPRQNIGKWCVVGFIIATASFDILAKSAALVAGTLRWSSLLGTFLTALLLVFLWRGAAAAWWLAVIFIGLAMAFCIVVATRMPPVFFFGLLSLLALLLALLVLPHTRAFLAHQRSKTA